MPSAAQRAAAARARAGRHRRQRPPSPISISSDSEDDIVLLDHQPTPLASAEPAGTGSDSDIELLEDGVDERDLDASWNSVTGMEEEGNDSETSASEVEELEGDELVQSLEGRVARELRVLEKLTPYLEISCARMSAQAWRDGPERTRMGGYSGNSERTERRKKKEARERDARDVVSQNSKQATTFTAFFSFQSRKQLPAAATPSSQAASAINAQTTAALQSHTHLPTQNHTPPHPADPVSIQTPPTDTALDGYASDISEDADDFFDDDDRDRADD
ncbi:hypothetical protein MKEN_00287100 [Mycena kentingensis (nom. inval.)]|nr:hypothetical protein MKEN_00287100 [Mycena kentingensis (nom. inval.)]